MNFATEMYLRSMMNLSREEIGQRMVTTELAQGAKIRQRGALARLG